MSAILPTHQHHRLAQPKTNPDQAPRSQFVLASYWSGAKFKFTHWQSPNFTHTHFIEQYQLTWPYLSQLAIHLAFYTLPVDLLSSFPHFMCSITRLQDLKKSLPSFVITKFQQYLHQPQSTTKIHSHYLGCPTPTFGIINQDNMASSTPTNITTSIPSTSTNMAPSDSKSQSLMLLWSHYSHSSTNIYTILTPRYQHWSNVSLPSHSNENWGLSLFLSCPHPTGFYSWAPSLSIHFLIRPTHPWCIMCYLLYSDPNT